MNHFSFNSVKLMSLIQLNDQYAGGASSADWPGGQTGPLHGEGHEDLLRRALRLQAEELARHSQ
jgi:hypothetical protein